MCTLAAGRDGTFRHRFSDSRILSHRPLLDSGNYSPRAAPLSPAAAPTHLHQDVAGGPVEIVQQLVAQLLQPSSQGWSNIAAHLSPGASCTAATSPLSGSGTSYRSPDKRCLPRAGKHLLRSVLSVPSNTASQGLARAGSSSSEESPREGVVGGCHLTGRPSCLAPTYTPSLLAPQAVLGFSDTRLSRAGIGSLNCFGVPIPARGNRTPEPPGEQWGNAASASPTAPSPCALAPCLHPCMALVRVPGRKNCSPKAAKVWSLVTDLWSCLSWNGQPVGLRSTLSASNGGNQPSARPNSVAAYP